MSKFTLCAIAFLIGVFAAAVWPGGIYEFQWINDHQFMRVNAWTGETVICENLESEALCFPGEASTEGIGFKTPYE